MPAGDAGRPYGTPTEENAWDVANELRTENARLRAQLVAQQAVVDAARAGLDKQTVMRLAQGAINESIRAHGPVTFDMSLSAAKRVAGQITTHYANLVGAAQAAQPESER